MQMQKSQIKLLHWAEHYPKIGEPKAREEILTNKPSFGEIDVSVLYSM